SDPVPSDPVLTTRNRFCQLTSCRAVWTRLRRAALRDAPPQRDTRMDRLPRNAKLTTTPNGRHHLQREGTSKIQPSEAMGTRSTHSADKGGSRKKMRIGSAVLPWLVAAAVVLGPTIARAQDNAESESNFTAAKTHYERGRSHYTRSEYDKAIVEFEKAYA